MQEICLQHVAADGLSQVLSTTGGDLRQSRLLRTQAKYCITKHCVSLRQKISSHVHNNKNIFLFVTKTTCWMLHLLLSFRLLSWVDMCYIQSVENLYNPKILHRVLMIFLRPQAVQPAFVCFHEECRGEIQNRASL